MHVLIVPSEHFVTSGYPLGGIFQFQQANALHKAGYQVGVIALGVISPRFLFRCYDYPDFDAANGYPVYRRYVRRFYPQRWMRPDRYIPFYQNLGQELYRTYKKQFGKPDVIHSHNIQFAALIAQAIRDLDNVPYVITEHSGTWRTAAVAREMLPFIQNAIQYSSAMTAVSRALANAIGQQIGIKDIDVLPNVIDSVLTGNPLHNCRTSSAHAFVFLNIASLDANKDQTSLIEAFANHFKGKPVSLRIGGTGPLNKHLKKLARGLGVERQVTLLGYLDRPAVMQEMQAADCFVLSSRQETFGVVLIEALACGTPLISTRCGGPEDIVNEENGILVAPGDVDALGKAMVRMTQTKGRYQANILRDECKIRFGDEAFLTKIAGFYSKALGIG